MPDLDGKIAEFLTIPSADPRLIPLAEEVMKAVREAAPKSEDLQRYRETRDRMGETSDVFFSPPNFPYTVHTA